MSSEEEFNLEQELLKAEKLKKTQLREQLIKYDGTFSAKDTKEVLLDAYRGVLRRHEERLQIRKRTDAEMDRTFPVRGRPKRRRRRRNEEL